MLPQELRELGERREIVISDNCKPILADKIRYYTEPIFMQRLLPVVKVAPIDLDAFLQRRGGVPAAGQLGNKVIEVASGSVVAPGATVTADVMPTVTRGNAPVEAEVIAMADWLFRNVDWNAPLDAADVDGVPEQAILSVER